jgi:hypothetical protein
MEHYEEYAKLTKEHNWWGICELNGITNKQAVNAKKALSVLPEQLQEGEIVFAITNGISKELKTGNRSLVVLSNERLLFLEASTFSNSGSTQSIRYDNVQAVTAVQGWFMDKLSIDLGARVITIDPCMQGTAKIVANIANKWLKELADKKATQIQTPSSRETTLDKLEKLAKLHQMGALSDEEFNTEKQKLLASNSL